MSGSARGNFRSVLKRIKINTKFSRNEKWKFSEKKMLPYSVAKKRTEYLKSEKVMKFR